MDRNEISDISDISANLPAPAEPRFDGTQDMCDRLLARIEELRYRANRVLSTIVTGPRGQNLTVAEARERGDLLADRIDMDEVRGSLRHRPVTRLTKLLTLVALAVVDLPIMLWLTSSVFDVNWAAPLGLPLVISVVVSILGTGGAAVSLHHLGHNQRQNKNDRRQLDWHGLSGGARTSLAGAGLLILLIGVVMFFRVYTEGMLSGIEGLAALLAVLVAFVMVISAALVFWTAFRDGSLEQDDLVQLSRTVRRHLALREGYADEAYVLTAQYRRMLRRGDRRREEPHAWQ